VNTYTKTAAGLRAIKKIMKLQTKLVAKLKSQIASFLRLVSLGIRKYIIQLIDLEAQLEAALKSQIKSMKVQIKIGSEWHTTERRGAMVTVNGQPIFKALKALSQEWELVGNKGKHGKWCIAEYELPIGAQVEFSATANGKEKITYSFVVGAINSVDVDGYTYSNDTCGWIVSI
jgi:hypothetical protein